MVNISIVTPSFNQGIYLEDTIQSVLDQGYPNLEYIIIDGGSTDNSADIIKKYKKHLTFWVIEKDKGQADAINKGLKHCTGDVFNWINSDDILYPGALKKISEYYRNGVDAVAGQVVQFYEDKEQSHIKENKNISAESLILNPFDTCFHQPGLWLNLKNMNNIGEFRPDMHYCFDQEYYIRYFQRYPKITYTDDILVKFRLHSTSKTVSNSRGFLDEQEYILSEIASGRIINNKGLSKKANQHFMWLQWKEELKKAKQEGGIANFFNIVIKMIKGQHKINRYTLGTLKSMLLK